MEGSIAKLTEEIAAIEAGIKALGKAVAKATEQRKEENADYKHEEKHGDLCQHWSLCSGVEGNCSKGRFC